MTRTASNLWPVYEVGSVIVVPRAQKMRGGPSFDVPPFKTFDATDPALPERLSSLFQSENLDLVDKPPSEDTFSSKEFFKLLKVRSWRELYAKCRYWTVSRADDAFEVDCWRAVWGGRGMEPDPEAQASMEKTMTLDRLVDFFLRELAAKPQEK